MHGQPHIRFLECSTECFMYDGPRMPVFVVHLLNILLLRLPHLSLKTCVTIPMAPVITGIIKHFMNFIVILKPCHLYLLYAYIATKLHLNLLN